MTSHASVDHVAESAVDGKGLATLKKLVTACHAVETGRTSSMVGDRYREQAAAAYRRALHEATALLDSHVSAADFLAMSLADTDLAPAVVEHAERGRLYRRHGDMTPPGDSVLSAVIQDDGDVCLSLAENKRGEVHIADIEFCTIGTGGGKSPKTVAALRALVHAMAEDAAQGQGA